MMQAPAPAAHAGNRNETSLEQVQRDIVASLFNGKRLTRESRSERYLAHRLAALGRRGRMWAFKLAWTPLDDDFIYLCYQLIFKRAPEPAGFIHLQTLLLTRAATRMDVLTSLLKAPEAASSLAAGETALPVPLLLARLRQLAARVPLLSPMCWAAWRTLSATGRLHRMELAQLDAYDDMEEAHCMLGDTLEYVHNKKSGRPVFLSGGQ